MTVTYARESGMACFGEALPLLERHYEEIARWHDIALDPHLALYRTIEDAGQLRVYTARLERQLIGYAVFFVRVHPHYHRSLRAVQDLVYVAPEHRGGRVGWRLLKFAEAELQAEGVQVVLHHTKIAHPELGELLRLLGYEQSEIIWTKRLDK